MFSTDSNIVGFKASMNGKVGIKDEGRCRGGRCRSQFRVKLAAAGAGGRSGAPEIVFGRGRETRVPVGVCPRARVAAPEPLTRRAASLRGLGPRWPCPGGGWWRCCGCARCVRPPPRPRRPRPPRRRRHPDMRRPRPPIRRRPTRTSVSEFNKHYQSPRLLTSLPRSVIFNPRCRCGRNAAAMLKIKYKYRLSQYWWTLDGPAPTGLTTSTTLTNYHL